jgi:hypothetical protein
MRLRVQPETKGNRAMIRIFVSKLNVKSYFENGVPLTVEEAEKRIQEAIKQGTYVNHGTCTVFGVTTTDVEV